MISHYKPNLHLLNRLSSVRIKGFLVVRANQIFWWTTIIGIAVVRRTPSSYLRNYATHKNGRPLFRKSSAKALQKCKCSISKIDFKSSSWVHVFTKYFGYPILGADNQLFSCGQPIVNPLFWTLPYINCVWLQNMSLMSFLWDLNIVIYILNENKNCSEFIQITQNILLV